MGEGRVSRGQTRPINLESVSESHVTSATSVPILVFLSLSLSLSLCSRLRPDLRDRQTSDAHRRLISPRAGHNKLCGRPPQYAPAPETLTFDLLTLKAVSESRVTWATSVPILLFLGLSVPDLGPMYATDRRQTDTDKTDSIIA